MNYFKTQRPLPESDYSLANFKQKTKYVNNKTENKMWCYMETKYAYL